MKLPLFIIAASIAFSAGAESSCAISTPDGRVVTVTAVSPNILRVVNAARGEKVPEPHWGKSEKMDVPSVTEIKKEGEDNVITTTGGIKAVLTPDGAVKISQDGKLMLTDNGLREKKGGLQYVSLATGGDLHFYGAGERGYSFNIAGDTMVMYNKQNYGYTAGEPRIKQMGICMPLFLSSSGYAVAFADYGAATMTMTNPVVYQTESRFPIAYYYINGAGTLDGATRQLASLTGRQPLAPFWSLGYITSKYGYRTQAEALGVVDTLKSQGYPLDGIVLDLYWYGKEQDMGRLAWDPDQWPDHKQMLAELNKEGVHLIPISQPYVLRNGRAIDNYDYLAPKGMLVADTAGRPLEVEIWVGKGGMLDVSNPMTRYWLSERYKQLTDEGVAGWWGDLGEPEVHPDSALHYNGLRTREYHNLYGNDWSKLIYDMTRQHYPGRRVMTMMRAGTTGLGKYGVFPWSTDVSRSWGGLQPQVTIMLNSGLSGLGYMSSDIGGFAIDDNHPYDPELYVRWLQMGTFSPVLRTHAQKTAEPYHYPGQQDIILDLVKERYRWLPYNYSLAFENALHGTPLVRPLNFYSGDKKYDDITDEYLWGRDLLVAPVMEQGVTERRVVFPKGAWVDMADASKVYHEGDTIIYPAPLEVLPKFVRAGAFIPLANYEMKNTGDYDPNRYLVNYYPVEGVNEQTVLYEDDRKSPLSIQRGEYATITFDGNDRGKKGIDITVTSRGSYPGMAPDKHLDFRIHNVSRPDKVLINGRKADKRQLRYDSTHRVLEISTPWTVARDLHISIQPN